MLISTPEFPKTDRDTTQELETNQATQNFIQHGLLQIPTESLNHITAFLDPPALLALGSVSKSLYHHVQTDLTWQVAFFCQFLGIPPECPLSETHPLLLRRTESTWKNEFIARYQLKRRWERSPATTITHTPHDSPIAAMHLMPENGLLASSLQYGIVSRSLPLSGKVLRGFLDASGDGLGVGNPNQEFTPNISACAIASDGGTALVLWGFRSGLVSIVFASRAMERRGRASVFVVQCSELEKHDGAVLDAIWGRNGRIHGFKSSLAVVTGGADGRVKLWHARRAQCLWSSQVPLHTIIPDPCVKIAAELDRGVVAGAMKSGEIVVWTGLHAYLPSGPPNTALPPPVDEIRIPRPFPVTEDEKSASDQVVPHAPFALHVDCCCRDYTHRINILIAYENHPQFYRLRIDPVSHAPVEPASAFVNRSDTAITALLPSFSSDDEGATHPSSVFTGDALGFVSAYDWNAHDDLGPIMPARTFAAYTDGSGVSTLARTDAVLATGSTRGVVCVWDALTLGLLLVLPSPGLGPRVRARVREGEEVARAPVSQIVLGSGDVLVAAVGSRAMSWKLGTAWHGKGKGVGGVNKVRKWERTSSGRYQQQQELKEEIHQTRLELEAEGRAQIRPSYEGEIEQQEQLAALGLSEVEAVEYVLMVSRDEEEERLRATSSTDEGVFSVDSDDVMPRSSLIPESRRSSAGQHSDSNSKVHVSPRARPEPMQAGILSLGSLGSGRSANGNVQFPAMTRAEGASDGSGHTSPSTMSDKSAWKTPLRAATSTHANTRTRNHAQDLLFDEELRIAIELSLMEARNLGAEQ